MSNQLMLSFQSDTHQSARQKLGHDSLGGTFPARVAFGFHHKTNDPKPLWPG
jgi:hypothetical protein